MTVILDGTNGITPAQWTTAGRPSSPTAKYSGTYTGTPTISTSGSNTILQFLSSGSYTA
jgi:hypothetical protein